jgi:hypothetical protein
MIIQAVIRYLSSFDERVRWAYNPRSSLSSPDSDTKANDLVIVAHGAHGDLKRLTEMGISQLF